LKFANTHSTLFTLKFAKYEMCQPNSRPNATQKFWFEKKCPNNEYWNGFGKTS